MNFKDIHYEVLAPWPNFYECRMKVHRGIIIYYHKVYSMKKEAIQIMSKKLFCKNRQNKCCFKIENNVNSAKVRNWLGHIDTCIHIQAKFSNLLNISAVINKTNF